jgi:hypothetical protein
MTWQNPKRPSANGMRNASPGFGKDECVFTDFFRMIVTVWDYPA